MSHIIIIVHHVTDRISAVLDNRVGEVLERRLIFFFRRGRRGAFENDTSPIDDFFTNKINSSVLLLLLFDSKYVLSSPLFYIVVILDAHV